MALLHYFSIILNYVDKAQKMKSSLEILFSMCNI